MKRPRRAGIARALVGVLLLPASAAAADLSIGGVDLSFSAYGTLGYAVSDQPYRYQRFIDETGTFRRDSLGGVQVDARFASRFGATVQLKLAPDATDDDRYEGTVAWAFVSYRPTDDWLFRAGKQRIPLYLYSETVDVGVTYDFARLPTEMYSIVSSNDFTGLSLSKTWTVGDGELALDAYLGKATYDFRFYRRDDVPPIQTPGPYFMSEKLNLGGAVLSYKPGGDTYRFGIHQGIGRLKDGQSIPTSFPFVQIAPGIGYYQVSDSMPGPGVVTTASERATVFTLGADVGFGDGWRVTAEWARTQMPAYDISIASSRGYASLLKRIDRWTPYVLYAYLRSASNPRNFYPAVNYNRVPDFIPGAAQINESQRIGADGFLAWDQHSWSIGTAYAFSATHKIKAEVMRTRVGTVSHFVDAPSFGDVRDQDITVFSISYSFVF